MQKDIFPQNDAKLKAWLDKFGLTIQNYGTQLGIGAAEVTQAINLCSEMAQQITVAKAAMAAAKSANTKKKEMRKTHLGPLRKIMRRMKASPAYNSALGTDMGIITSRQRVDPNTFKPQLKVSTEASMIAVRFKKYGMERFEFYGRRDGEEKFQMIGARNFSPFYFKPEALPGNPAQTWHIKAVAVLRDEPVGQWSNEYQVLFKPTEG
jgi:hypothetical protein